MPEHSRQELRVFERFSEYCPLRIDPTSIEKREPPRPDIYCRTEDGKELAFELVEVVDRDLATATSQQLRLERLLLDAVAGDSHFRANFDDALISVVFDRSSSMQRRRNAAAAVVEYLKQLRGRPEGKLELARTALSTEITRLEVVRGDSPGPSFYVEAVTSFSDPTLKTINSKLQRDYSTPADLHLLGYFELQPMDVGTEWRPGYLRLVRQALSGSQFRSVWLFELNSGRILQVQDKHDGDNS
ncbi:MAG: hypothetical protein SX243_18590 [Acidobacteriota bacterium]|nr:hypothetical protein [Acidobacteriota bacterium]